MGTDRLSAEEVRRVARLAMLALSNDEVERLRDELGSVLGYMQRLGSMDLEGVEPMPRPTQQRAIPREDEPGPTLTPEEVRTLAEGQDQRRNRCEGAYLRVPKVLGEGSA